MSEQKRLRLEELLLVIKQEAPKAELSSSENLYIAIINSVKEQDEKMYHTYLDKWIQLDYVRFKDL